MQLDQGIKAKLIKSAQRTQKAKKSGRLIKGSDQARGPTTLKQVAQSHISPTPSSRSRLSLLSSFSLLLFLSSSLPQNSRRPFHFRVGAAGRSCCLAGAAAFSAVAAGKTSHCCRHRAPLLQPASRHRRRPQRAVGGRTAQGRPRRRPEQPRTSPKKTRFTPGSPVLNPNVPQGSCVMICNVYNDPKRKGLYLKEGFELGGGLAKKMCNVRRRVGRAKVVLWVTLGWKALMVEEGR
ncbi:uncharacterized protein LOC121767067 [Salvia splendens]|uniref:uncharacterized protein LOC121767067 n=1 Tax=Salvia splendens TaxID=180675 RepID=UPI001C26CACA|nr:uncharacterized protein LOC121767067 [Salvia splendens]